MNWFIFVGLTLKLTLLLWGICYVVHAITEIRRRSKERRLAWKSTSR